MSVAPRILVTGAGGFLGTHVLRLLGAENGSDIVAVYRQPRSDPAGQAVDLSGFDETQQLIRTQRPTRLFHLAGRIPGVGSGGDGEMIRANVNGLLNILESIRQEGISCRVVTVGSAAEYGPSEDNSPLLESADCRPTGLYGYSKWLATRIAADYSRLYGLDIRVARVFNMIGPGVSRHTVAGAALERYFRAAPDSTGQVPVRMGDLSARRDWVDVRDVARSLLALMEAPNPDPVVNIASGKSVSAEEVIEGMFSHADRTVALQTETRIARTENPSEIIGDNERLVHGLSFDFEYPLARTLKDMWEHASDAIQTQYEDHQSPSDVETT